MSRVPTEHIDYTSRDYLAYKELLINKLKEKMPEYTDTSETDAGIVILEALANGLDIISLYSDIIANDVILPTSQNRNIATLIANTLGYYPYYQTPSIYSQVFVLNSVLEEDIVIPKGTQISTKETPDLDTLYYETMEDLVIPAGKLGNEQDEEGNYVYSVVVHSGVSIYEDIIGTSSGTPLQSFELNYDDVLIDSIELYVDEGEGATLWSRVDNFLDSDENSLVYTATIDDFNVCSIHFGNGLKGKIPISFPNGIVANYRVGGGESSNVNENIITELVSDIPYVEETFNLSVLVRGHDRESLESIKQNAPNTFRTRDRLVTLEDYEDLLELHFYDFLDIKAIRDTSSKKLVHIFYILRENYNITDELLENVSVFIGESSMIGTSYDINPYTPQSVDLEANLYVDLDYNKETLENDIKEYIEDVIFEYSAFKFGSKLVKSDLESEIKSTFKGVLSFRITNNPSEAVITPTNPQNILKLGTLTIQSQYL